ncbi:MAG: TniQ family protein [Xanthomonadales bacterium]|nr:TniQ family protein [Xanthomonadales bacterium]
MIGGTWPYRVPLYEDELLSSFLVRNAYAHGTTPYCFLNLYWPGKHIWNRDIDRTVDHDWLDALAILAGIPAAQLEASTLLPLRAILGSTLRNGDTPLLLSASVFHRTRRRHSLQFCPICLVEGRRWFRRIWRLGFVFVCPEHGNALLDACPKCGSPVVPHRSLGLDPSRCHQCGTFLGNEARETLLQTGVLEWQNLLLGALSSPPRLAGPFVQSEAFAVVRSLLSVLTPRPVHTAIREAVHLPLVALPADRLQFEHARIRERALLMETLAAWVADWPVTFRRGAHAARLTQRAFRRLTQPATLRSEVEQLPLGIARDRAYVPKVLDNQLRRLARKDRSAYRALRARRLQELVGLV